MKLPPKSAMFELLCSYIYQQDVIPIYPTTCNVEWVDAEDPLFLLYTSGSTGKPKVRYVLRFDHNWVQPSSLALLILCENKDLQLQYLGMAGCFAYDRWLYDIYSHNVQVCI
jgi:hypothetical protein